MGCVTNGTARAVRMPIPNRFPTAATKVFSARRFNRRWQWRRTLCLSLETLRESGSRSDSRVSLAELDQSARVTHSAKGATARPHIGAVSDRRAAKGAIRRQFPSLCSKSHSRLSGSFMIQSSRNASTCGRTGSIRSQARLSRALVSTWSTPRPDRDREPQPQDVIQIREGCKDSSEWHSGDSLQVGENL